MRAVLDWYPKLTSRVVVLGGEIVPGDGEGQVPVTGHWLLQGIKEN